MADNQITEEWLKDVNFEIWTDQDFELLKRVCEKDDQYWYVTNQRKTLDELTADLEKSQQDTYGSGYTRYDVTEIISQLRTNWYELGRISEPKEPIDGGSSLTCPFKEPWDQTAFDAENSLTLKYLLWRDYEDEALRLCGEAKGKAGTCVKSWADVANIMTTLAVACSWGWRRTSKREYTRSKVRHRLQKLKSQGSQASFTLPEHFVFRMARH